MLNFSVNTNVGAFVALQNLSQTNRDLEVTQNRINTGLKVASTKDDSGTYAIAQNLRADIGGLNAVKTSLDRAQSTLDVAISAAESISDVLVQMKEKSTAAADEGLDEESLAALEDDYNALANQISTYINSAEFNGTNILSSTADGAISALLSANPDSADDATTLKVENLSLDTDLSAVIADATWGDASAAEATMEDVIEAIEDMNKHLSTLGAASRQIANQQTFMSKLSDTIETGIGNLVDADLAKESANLQALQTKQQLGLQALSIANQAPQSIMSLFRN